MQDDKNASLIEMWIDRTKIRDQFMLIRPLLSCLVLVFILSSTCAGQTPNPAGDFELALQAIKERNVPELKAVLDRNQKVVEQKDATFDATPLHWAAVERDVDIIKLLLAHGASRAARNSEQATPLMLAIVPSPGAKRDAKQSTKEVVSLLLDEEVIEFENSVGKTALHLAAENDDIEAVLTLLEKGANPIAKTIMMKEPWQLTSNQQLKKTLRDKATARVSENLKNSLQEYARTGDLPKLKALLQEAGNKLNLNSQYADQETALIIAAKNSHFEVVAYLIKMNADFNLVDVKGHKVWQYLCPQQIR